MGENRALVGDANVENGGLLVRDCGDLSAYPATAGLQRVRIEAWKQICLALPMVGFNLVQCARQVLSLVFVGHLGKLELSSASIATSLCNVTGFSFILGLAFALDTLCGQAYGAKQYHWLGIYMQRATLVLCIIAVAISVAWFNMESILLFFHQAPEISLKGGMYARWLIPGLFADAFVQPLSKFLQTQSKVLPLFLCSCMALLSHTLLCWIFIYELEMGNRGAALATSLTNWLTVMFLVCSVILTPGCKQCWPGFSKEAFRDMPQFFKIAIPSAVMICLEWWAFEALTLLSGLLPNPQLEVSVFSILLTITQLCSMPTYAICTAASVRTSNELGAGQPHAAQFSFYISMCLSTIYAMLVGCILLLSRNVLGRAFSSDAEICSFVTKLSPLVVCLVVVNTFQGVGSGVTAGCGWQALAAFVDIGAYYIVGLPTGYILAFVVKLGGQGLLFGCLCGDLVQTITMLAIAATTDWVKQARSAVDRVSSSASSPLLE